MLLRDSAWDRPLQQRMIQLQVSTVLRLSLTHPTSGSEAADVVLNKLAASRTQLLSPLPVM